MKRRWWIEGPLILAGVFAVWYGATTFPGQDLASNLSSEVAPAGAVRYIESHGLTGCLINWYTWGGYLINRRIPVFIDGRDDVYLASTQVFQDYIRATKLEVDPRPPYIYPAPRLQGQGCQGVAGPGDTAVCH